MLFSASVLLALIPTILAADSSSKHPKPCTLHSPTTGSYYDLSKLQLHPPSSKSSSKEARTDSWHARGYDYGANFTLNFCGPVIEDLGKVEGVSEAKVANVSAFYKKGAKTYSIGEASSEPIFRGRKLVLNYTDGSPCPENPSSSLNTRGLWDDDDDDDDEEEDERQKFKSPPGQTSSSTRRKSTIISFLCDRDPQYTDHPQISFIGSVDSCSYHFEVRSRAACGGAQTQSPSSLGPGGVFGVILGIAVCVYLIGGCAYQRTVMHQRGWRQCPNWQLWKGLVDFVGDTFIILTSSLAHTLHLDNIFSFNRAFNTGGGGGYHRVGESGAGGRGSGRSGGRQGDEDDENRLIDQLDETWDD